MPKPTPKHPIDRGAPASIVVGKFGGLAKFSKATGHPVGTVHRWLVKGYIDGKYHDGIRAAAGPLKVKLSPLDFVETRPPEKRGAQAEAAIA